MKKLFGDLLGVGFVFLGIGGMYFPLEFFVKRELETMDMMLPIAGFLFAFPSIALFLGIEALGETGSGRCITLAISGLSLMVFGGFVAGHFLEASIVGANFHACRCCMDDKASHKQSCLQTGKVVIAFTDSSREQMMRAQWHETVRTVVRARRLCILLQRSACETRKTERLNCSCRIFSIPLPKGMLE